MLFLLINLIFSDSVVIVEKKSNKTDFVIVVASGNSDVNINNNIFSAGNRFQSVIYSMTNNMVKIPVVKDVELETLPEKCIILGDTKFTTLIFSASEAENLRNRITKNPEFGDDSYHLEIKKNRVVVFGGIRGCIFGCQEILEKQLGYFYFGKFFKDIPQHDEIVLNFEPQDHIPTFAMRELYWGDGVPQEQREIYRFRPIEFGIGGTSHNVFSYVNPNNYFNEHPEYFSLRNGKRIARELCITNPDVYNIVKDKMIQNMKNDITKKYFAFAHMDTSEPCECDECLKIRDQTGSHAGVYVWFVNKLLNEIKKDNEIAKNKIVIFAYQFSETPPNNIVADSNIVVWYAPIGIDHLRSLNESSFSENNRLKNCLENWSKIVKEVFVWTYSTSFSAAYSVYPCWYSMQKDLQIFHKNGANSIFIQHGNYLSELNDLKSYYLSRLMWNPYQDSKELINYFCLHYYGEYSHKKMQEYIYEYHDVALENKVYPYTWVFTDFGEIRWWDANKTFLKYLEVFEDFINHEKGTKYEFNLLKSSIPCLHMAFNRHLKSAISGIKLRYNWDNTINYIVPVNQDAQSQLVAKRYFDRHIIKPANEPNFVMFYGWNDNSKLNEIKREGHGLYIDKLNGKQISCGISNDYNGRLGSFTKKNDDFNYINGNEGGVDFISENSNNLISFNANKNRLYSNKVNGSMKYQSNSDDGKVIKSYEIIERIINHDENNTEELLLINYSIINKENKLVQDKPVYIFNLNLGNVDNICYKIEGKDRTSSWNLFNPSNKANYNYVDIDYQAFLSESNILEVGSILSKRSVLINIEKGNYQRILLVTNRKTNSVSLYIQDNVEIEIGSGMTKSFKFQGLLKEEMPFSYQTSKCETEHYEVFDYHSFLFKNDYTVLIPKNSSSDIKSKSDYILNIIPKSSYSEDSYLIYSWMNSIISSNVEYDLYLKCKLKIKDNVDLDKNIIKIILRNSTIYSKSVYYTKTLEKEVFNSTDLSTDEFIWLYLDRVHLAEFGDLILIPNNEFVLEFQIEKIKFVDINEYSCSSTSKEGNNKSKTIGIVIGVVLSLIIVAVIIAVLVIFLKKKRHNKDVVLMSLRV